MPIETEKLKALMDKYFGPMGSFLLEKEMKLVGIQDINAADESTRGRLAEGIYRDCLYTIMSETKARMVFAEVESILEVKIPPLEGSIRHTHAAVAKPMGELQ